MYSQIFAFVFASFALLSLCRIGLISWQWQRVREARGVWPILLGGLRIDAHLIALSAAPALIVAPWLSESSLATAINGIWLQIVWLLICLLELSTPLFIIEYDTRPNRLYVDYLKHPREVFGMLWKGYKTAALLTIAGLSAFAVLGHFLFTDWGQGFSPSGLLAQFGLLLASALLAFLAIRGTLRHRPINPSTVAFCSDPLLNNLALNSLYSVMYAIYSMKNERSPADAYGKLPEQEVIASIREHARLTPPITTEHIPTLHNHVLLAAHHTATPRHVVLIVEESLGAKYTGHLGGLSLTPNLDALSAQAWTFTQAYATGTRSVRGLEALVDGFHPSL